MTTTPLAAGGGVVVPTTIAASPAPGTAKDATTTTQVAAQVVLSGSFKLALGDTMSAEVFCADPASLQGLRSSLADASGVAAQQVDVQCMPARRLEGGSRRLVGATVDVSYTVKVPAVASSGSGASASAALTKLKSLDEAGWTHIVSIGLAQAGSAAAAGVSVTALSAPAQAGIVAPADDSPPSLLNQAEDVLTKGAGIGWFLLPVVALAFCFVCFASYFACCRRKNRAASTPSPGKTKKKRKAAAATRGVASNVAVGDGSGTLMAEDIKLSDLSTQSTEMLVRQHPPLQVSFDCHIANRPPRDRDEASESTLATSASAFWRAGLAQRRPPLGNERDPSFVLQVTDERTSRPLERTREPSPNHPGIGSIKARKPPGRFGGHWLRRGSPEFAAEIRGDVIRYHGGSEKKISLAEDGALELEGMNGELCKGRLLGEELLWDDGDMWSRARSAAYSWRMADFASDGVETPGPEPQAWRLDNNFGSQQHQATPDSFGPLPAVAAEHEAPSAGGLLGCGRGASEEAAFAAGGRRKTSDRCYTC